jgi:hypothetical protein
MAAALLYSERRLGLDPAFASASRSVCLTLAGGEFPELPDEEALKRLFKADKKIREGRLKFIALPKPCRAELIEASPDDIIGAARGLEAERKSGKLRPSA